MKRLPNALGFLLVGILGTGGCSDAGFVTPPQQLLGSALNTPSAEENPRFSYDGRYLVFASDRQNQRTIYLFDRVANRLVPLPGLNQPNTYQDEPDISADGRYIVYVSEGSGKPDIYVYDRQTLQATNLTENLLGEKRRPTISGNGRLIAFESNRFGQWNVEIFDRGVDIPVSLPSENPSPEK
ncbi:biopolymer transporter [Pannus brasiliensis CCIBt3594]|uniref:Biopolymer transporter n=1 Tax=Pannus brasiliensis CCIBt3594 TaxID=1427578 RepID=A0AAW9QRV2_9CHRO